MRTVRKIAVIVIWVCLLAAVLDLGYMLEKKLNEYRIALDKHTERTLEARKGRDVDFKKLKKQNPDTKGWIWLSGTNIDYPIVQGPDNDYYLHRDFDGNYLYDGCIFIDAAVKTPFSPDENTVIYGHRMRSGAMFNNLGKYADKEFFDDNPVIIIETEDGSYDLHVIAFCTELSDSDLYTTSFYNGLHSQPELFDDIDGFDDAGGLMTKADFVDLVRKKAVNISDEDFSTDDTFVTLSTCAYSSGEHRNQVIGILKDAALNEKSVVVTEQKPFVNRWLLAQIGVGILMLFAVVFTAASLFRKDR